MRISCLLFFLSPLKDFLLLFPNVLSGIFYTYFKGAHIQMDTQQLYFLNDIGKQKPESIRNRSAACPFCDRENLTDILATEDSIIWLKNKFPTLKDTFQTVLIETDNCEDHIATYTEEHMRSLIRFSIQHWLDLQKNEEFTSVILYKNHGPFSGGSLHHAHMQIIGMKYVDYLDNVEQENFQGVIVQKNEHIELNISDRPIIGFTEFNIIIEDVECIDELANYIQQTVRYILTDFHKGCSSYNLFFYYLDGKIICKVVPRFVVSPLYVGYKIPQVSTKLEDVKIQLAQYFTSEKDTIIHKKTE
ncbi:DUF4931 domain-containing protein [Bacillus cereus group sp. RP37]|nr:DUF4931 domain-containing protein [Bacillus wiedmannii]EOP03467.1 galactose-1-phosphate uridylyltransferase [Bacillus cereus BAG2O-3]EOQ18465.1 galactose-1-phosphate uridylyltransferase [Bacillus cereus B5-2]EOQ35074.1 galactose-1-phosphate uridylyltransferase [Bacillus cereus BAG3O-1]MBJ8119173.1 DUF4931 domain-containing protein [Bacillus cereus]PFW75921.1 DUF4931 domain-containing protein [Bacillus sp. AFS075960]RFB09253.1 DUF4931 domain-containing protein [Bacillus sp. OE]RFB20105.1 D